MWKQQLWKLSHIVEESEFQFKNGDMFKIKFNYSPASGN